MISFITTDRRSGGNFGRSATLVLWYLLLMMVSFLKWCLVDAQLLLRSRTRAGDHHQEFNGSETTSRAALVGRGRRELVALHGGRDRPAVLQAGAVGDHRRLDEV